MEVNPTGPTGPIIGAHRAKEKLPPNPKFLPVPLGNPSKELSQIKAKLINPSLDRGMKNLAKVKEQLLSQYKNIPQQRLIKKTFVHFYHLMVGSVHHQKKFAEIFKIILENEELGEHFEKFLDLYIDARKQTMSKISEQEVIKVEDFMDLQIETVEINNLQSLTDDERELIVSLSKSLLDNSLCTNTQMFSDYILNPLYQVDHPDFKKPRATSLTYQAKEQNRKLSPEEKILDALGYYNRGDYFNNGTHGFKLLDATVDPQNPKQHIVEKVEYRIGIALPGSRVYETTFEVDFTPFLPENPTFEDSKKLFEMFKKHFNKAEKNIGQVENEINDKAFVNYLSQLRKEIPNKLVACVVGISDPKVDLSELLNDRTEELFHPKMVKSIEAFKGEEMDDPANVKLAVRLMREIGMEALNPKQFPEYFKRASEVADLNPDMSDSYIKTLVGIMVTMGIKKVKVEEFGEFFDRVEEFESLIDEKLNKSEMNEILKMHSTSKLEFSELLEVLDSSKRDPSDSNLDTLTKRNEDLDLPGIRKLVGKFTERTFPVDVIVESFEKVGNDVDDVIQILGVLSDQEGEIISKYLKDADIGDSFNEFINAAKKTSVDNEQKLAERHFNFMDAIVGQKIDEEKSLIDIANKIFAAALKGKGG